MHGLPLYISVMTDVNISQKNSRLFQMLAASLSWDFNNVVMLIFQVLT